MPSNISILVCIRPETLEQLLLRVINLNSSLNQSLDHLLGGKEHKLDRKILINHLRRERSLLWKQLFNQNVVLQNPHAHQIGVFLFFCLQVWVQTWDQFVNFHRERVWLDFHTVLFVEITFMVKHVDKQRLLDVYLFFRLEVHTLKFVPEGRLPQYVSVEAIPQVPRDHSVNARLLKVLKLLLLFPLFLFCELSLHLQPLWIEVLLDDIIPAPLVLEIGLESPLHLDHLLSEPKDLVFQRLVLIEVLKEQSQHIFALVLDDRVKKHRLVSKDSQDPSCVPVKWELAFLAWFG